MPLWYEAMSDYDYSRAPADCRERRHLFNRYAARRYFSFHFAIFQCWISSNLTFEARWSRHGRPTARRRQWKVRFRRALRSARVGEIRCLFIWHDMIFDGDATLRWCRREAGYTASPMRWSFAYIIPPSKSRRIFIQRLRYHIMPLIIRQNNELLSLSAIIRRNLNWDAQNIVFQAWQNCTCQ